MSTAPQAYNFEHLMRAIIDAPDDDRLRLNYALHLERSGLDAERATFIRLQIHLARLPQGVDHPEWVRLASSAHQLLMKGRERWIPSWYGSEDVRDVEFHRGFIECVTVSAHLMMRKSVLQRLLHTSPVRHLNIIGLEGDDELRLILEILASDRVSRRLVSLRLDGQNLSDQVIQHFGQFGFHNLRWLSIAHNSIGNLGVRALAEDSIWGDLRNLEYVNLAGNPGNPVDDLSEDQGIVIGRRKSQHAIDYDVRWLHPTIVAGRVVIPDRFALAAGGNAHSAEMASAAQ